jgi:hypothetical protein
LAFLGIPQKLIVAGKSSYRTLEYMRMLSSEATISPGPESMLRITRPKKPVYYSQC